MALSNKMHNLRALVGNPDDADADDDVVVHPCRRRQLHKLVVPTNVNVNGTAAGNAEDEPHDSTKAMAKPTTMMRAATIYNTMLYELSIICLVDEKYYCDQLLGVFFGIGIGGWRMLERSSAWWLVATYTWHIYCTYAAVIWRESENWRE